MSDRTVFSSREARNRHESEQKVCYRSDLLTCGLHHANIAKQITGENSLKLLPATRGAGLGFPSNY